VAPADVGDPVESGLDGQAGQHAVLGLVAIGGGDGYRAALVVKRLLAMLIVLVPALGDQQADAGPLVHHRVGQHVQLLLAALKRAEGRGDRLGIVNSQTPCLIHAARTGKRDGYSAAEGRGMRAFIPVAQRAQRVHFRRSPIETEAYTRKTWEL